MLSGDGAVFFHKFMLSEKMPRRTNLFFLLVLSSAAAMGATSYPQPLPSGFSPTSGPPGTVIIVTGTGFTGLSQVWIGNGKDSTVNVVNDGLVKITVAADASTSHLGFINPQHQEWTSTNFTVTSGSTGGAMISGAVSGGTGAAVHLSGTMSQQVQVNSNGSYQFTGIKDGAYTLTPTTNGHVFTPAAVAAEVTGSSIGGVNFAGTATTAPTYTISGSVSGVIDTRALITLNGKNIGSASTDLGGTYSFSGLPAGTYTVSAALPGHTFSQSRVVTVSNIDSPENNFSSVSTVGNNLQVAAVNPLPTATVGKAYSSAVSTGVSGGQGTYTFQTGSLSTGNPPLGMILQPNGTLTGTPVTAGTYAFEVCAADSAGGLSGNCAQTSLTVAASSSGGGGPPPPGTAWVFYGGQMYWGTNAAPNDWSFSGSANYYNTSGDPLTGSYDIAFTLSGQWGGWLPYANGRAFDTTPYSKFIFSLKPTVENQTWNVYFLSAGDTNEGAVLNLPGNYCSPALAVGVWTNCSIPMSAFQLTNTTILKFSIHDETGLSSNTWYVDNVGFSP
jgi:hypothetical protein